MPLTASDVHISTVLFSQFEKLEMTQKSTNDYALQSFEAISWWQNKSFYLLAYGNEILNLKNW